MKFILLLIFSFISAGNIFAQDSSLIKDIEDSLPATEKVTGAFKATRVINAHSVNVFQGRYGF